VARLWELEGWETEVRKQSGDRGVDVVARKDGTIDQNLVIQAKCYDEGNKVGRPAMQQYYSLRDQERADAVAVVTTSDFTDGAKAWGLEHNVKMVDGSDILQMLEKHEAGDLVDEFRSGTRSTTKPARASAGQRDRGGFSIRGAYWYALTYEQVYILLIFAGVAGALIAPGMVQMSTAMANNLLVLPLLLMVFGTPVLVYRDTKLAEKNGDMYQPGKWWAFLTFMGMGLPAVVYVYRRISRG